MSDLYMFKFGASLSRLFGVDVSNYLHNLMHNVDIDRILLGCLGRGCSEENEMGHK